MRCQESLKQKAKTQIKLSIICEETFRYNILNSAALEKLDYFFKDHKFLLSW